MSWFQICPECRQRTSGDCGRHGPFTRLPPLAVSTPPRRPFCCPVCNGAGTVSRPPYVAGDQPMWTANNTGPYPCKACGGCGIVWG